VGVGWGTLAWARSIALGSCAPIAFYSSPPPSSHTPILCSHIPPADLLDILSKGSNPQLILRHLPKNFDNVHNLSFRLDERGEPLKAATGMFSGEVRSAGVGWVCSMERGRA
jgi:hypothetical protein